ncbi:LysR family transcriptional regulator [Paracoccus litorisediminis]|jgi:DNA-binding transcriptional LysR family regulator|uniref:LysR family transcriptional regulator n=1 Tax=Paracoccus litorisediminis TaxID=2006130 RepID=A0A844HMA2_9RHOB|nr:LysR family transcriptional regulator [Paracoccus litorisediminis]MTH60996.1 LysR family transcriptional regulator [Paracoccus litorisediminis]
MRRLHDVDLKLLRTFKAIVEAGGLSGAQATLNSSQSTLSTQLADLEKRLGFRLCQRGRGGFALTPQGQKLLDALEDFLAAADHFQNEAASISGEMRGVLRLSVVDAMLCNAAWDLSAILRDFNARAKATLIELSAASPSDMERLVAEGKRDIAIGPFFRRNAGLSYVPLFQEHHALFCAAAHPLARSGPVQAATLRQHAFVARGYLHRYDVERVGHVEPAALVDTMETQALLIRSGRFIGYLPSHYAQTVDGLTRIETVEPVDYLSPIQLVHSTGASENILIRSFLNRVAEHPLRLDGPAGQGPIRPF